MTLSDMNKSLQKEMTSMADGEDKQGVQDYYLMINGKMDDVIGATASHEAYHATDPGNLKDTKENSDNAKKQTPGYIRKDVEIEPNKIEQKELDKRTQ